MKPRVFIGLTEVSGYYRGLKEGFDQLGVRATLAIVRRNPFVYQDEKSPWLARLIRGCFERSRGAIGPVRVLWRALEVLARTALLLQAAATHDLFIFGFGETFLKGRDLPLLRLLGKTVICQYHGSDSRPPFINGAVLGPEGQFDVDRCIAQTARQKAHIRRLDRWSSVVIDTPTQGHFHRGPFVNWLRVGLPCRPPAGPDDLRAAPPAPRGQGPLRLLHCPSKPLSKGSALIREAVARLRAAGLDLELTEIAGRPNSEVVAALRQCDVVIDQVFADYGMPGLATEAAWLGKPTILCGYAAALWERLLPPEACPPTLYCPPDELEAGIRRLALDERERLELGRRAREFVETQWSPSRVAQRYLDAAAGKLPPDWMCDPRDIRYVHGCGLAEAQARAQVRAMIDRAGPSCLQLDDKPATLAAFVEFAGKTPGPAATGPSRERPIRLAGDAP